MQRRNFMAALTTLALWGGVLSASPAAAQATCGAQADGYNVITSNASIIRGTEGPDYICAGSGANTIYALGGDDIILAGGGADVVWAGAGNDIVNGGYGADKLRGMYGHDTLDGGHGEDFVFGGPGRDELAGGAHRDVILGGRGNDIIWGNAGSDSLQGGDGADEIIGGAGSDYVFGGRGIDRIYGGDGRDDLFGGTSHDYIDGGLGDDDLNGGNGYDQLIGGVGDDFIRGGFGEDRIDGGDGEDRINGGPNNDRVEGGAGTDGCLGAEIVRECENVADNWPEPTTDFGVTNDVIRVGLSADLSGPFSGVVSTMVEAQMSYFERVNEGGGLDGRQIELVIYDNAYDIPTHLDNYVQLAEESDEGVVMISHSTGSPHTSAVAQDLIADDLVAVPFVSNYSGFSSEPFRNVFEIGANLCFEAMNAVEFLVAQSGLASPKLAIVSRPGEYGQDGAAGAQLAAEALGLETVDLEATIAGDDFTPIIATLLAEQPDIVFITSSPGELAQIFGGAAAGGLTALWSGSSPSYHPALLDTPVGPALDVFYFHSGYAALWEANESPGMLDMTNQVELRMPNTTYGQVDAVVNGWTQAMFTEAVLMRAVDNLDLTRAGVVAAAREVEVDFRGLAPDQTWAGEPNAFAVRGTYIYDVVLADATPTTSISEPGSSGLVLVAENLVGDVAAGHGFDAACFESPG